MGLCGQVGWGRSEGFGANVSVCHGVNEGSATSGLEVPFTERTRSVGRGGFGDTGVVPWHWAWWEVLKGEAFGKCPVFYNKLKNTMYFSQSNWV